MAQSGLNVITGATGYTGKYIARRLLAMGHSVKSVTGHLQRTNPFGDRISIAPFDFDDPKKLTENLRGAHTLYNTYWVRFSHGKTTFEVAVENTKTLLAAAKSAGVQKFIHISIANSDPNSPLPYYRWKGLLEQAVMNSGLSYAIIRPTVIFGLEDILVNNIAWCLRRFPFFAIAGTGNYQIQPIFVEDVVELAVKAAEGKDNVVFDAVGPEIFTFNQLVELIAGQVQSRAKIVHLHPRLALLLAQVIGCIVRDVVLTKEEVDGLLANLLVSSKPHTGKTRFSEWLNQHAATLGTTYSSELSRHYR